MKVAGQQTASWPETTASVILHVAMRTIVASQPFFMSCTHDIPRSASHQSGIVEIGIAHGYPPAGRRAPDRLDLGTVVLSAVGIGLSAFGIYILARARFARL